MASPSVSLTTLSRELGLYYEARLEELRAGYIADQVFPVRDVMLPSATFKKIPIEEILRVEPELKRSPTSGYWRSSFQFTQDSYITYDRGAEELVDDDEAAAYSEFIDLAREATNRLVHVVLQEKEMRVAATLMDTTVYTGGTLTQSLGNGQWSAAASTPITDIGNAQEKFFTNTGIYPNTLVINRKTFRALRQHPDIVAQVVSAGAGDQARTRDVTTQQLAQVLDVDRVLVGGGAKNTAGIGAAATIANVWPNHAMLVQVATSSDMREPCIGRQFHWSGSGSSTGGQIKVYREEAIRSDVVRVRQYSGEKLMHTEMGIMIQSVIS